MEKGSPKCCMYLNKSMIGGNVIGFGEVLMITLVKQGVATIAMRRESVNVTIVLYNVNWMVAFVGARICCS